jgi:hypothetical protein
MPQSLDKLNQSLQDLKSKVETMAPGGDLESLIEENLAAIGRQCYEMCLDARRQTATSQPEGFSPSEVSEVRGGVASGGDAPARGSDAARRSGLRTGSV